MLVAALFRLFRSGSRELLSPAAAVAAGGAVRGVAAPTGSEFTIVLIVAASGIVCEVEGEGEGGGLSTPSTFALLLPEFPLSSNKRPAG